MKTRRYRITVDKPGGNSPDDLVIYTELAGQYEKNVYEIPGIVRFRIANDVEILDTYLDKQLKYLEAENEELQEQIKAPEAENEELEKKLYGEVNQ